MVLDHDVRRPALPPYVGMEIGGDEPPRVGAVHHDLGIDPQIEELPVEDALARPRPIRPIIEARRVAVGGDGDGPVLPVIGDLPPVYGAGPVRIVGQRIAIGVVSDGRAA